MRTQDLPRAYQLGSLLRPPRIVELMNKQFTPDGLSPAEQTELAALIDAARVDCIERLIPLGKMPITGGEVDLPLYLGLMTRSFPFSSFDFGQYARHLNWHDDAGSATGPEFDHLIIPGVVGPMRWTGYDALEVEQFVLDETIKRGVRRRAMTSVPGLLHWLLGWVPGVTERQAGYDSYEALSGAVTPVLAEQAYKLANAGFGSVKIDDPGLLQLGDETVRAWLRREGLDPQHMLQVAHDSNNKVLRAIRKGGATPMLHMCRGNARSMRLSDAGPEGIAPWVFPTTEAAVLLFEALPGMNPNWRRILEYVPDSVDRVVLGVVNTKVPDLEDVNDIVAIVQAAAAASSFPLDRLAVSTQCGFASHMSGNLITPEVQWAKLGLVVEAANILWPNG